MELGYLLKQTQQLVFGATIYAVWASITFNMANNPAAALYLSRSTDRGKTWTSSQLAPFDQKNTTFPDPPRLAWTPGGGGQGTLHLVRQRAPRPELASVRDVIYQRSTDGGKTWSTALAIPFRE